MKIQYVENTDKLLLMVKNLAFAITKKHAFVDANKRIHNPIADVSNRVVLVNNHFEI